MNFSLLSSLLDTFLIVTSSFMRSNLSPETYSLYCLFRVLHVFLCQPHFHAPSPLQVEDYELCWKLVVMGRKAARLHSLGHGEKGAFPPRNHIH